MSILFLLFTIVPAVELYLLFKVGAVIGGLNAILLIILTGFVGANLARSQGLSILSRIQEKTAQGKTPGDELIEGFMIFAGGLLLLTPGILTDVLGFSLVFPLTRIFLRTLVKTYFERAIQNGSIKGNVVFSSNQSFYTNYSNGNEDFFKHSHQQRDASTSSDVFEAEFKNIDKKIDD